MDRILIEIMVMVNIPDNEHEENNYYEYYENMKEPAQTNRHHSGLVNTLITSKFQNVDIYINKQF